LEVEGTRSLLLPLRELRSHGSGKRGIHSGERKKNVRILMFIEGKTPVKRVNNGLKGIQGGKNKIYSVKGRSE